MATRIAYTMIKAPTTYLIGNNKFSWNGNIHHLPKMDYNVADGCEAIQNCFINILRLMDEDLYYMKKIPKEKIREFALKKAAEKIKDMPPDPLFFKIYITAQIAVLVFLTSTIGSAIAKL